MKGFKNSVLLLFALLAMGGRAHAQIAAMSMDEIIRTHASKDTLYVINFWATWCAPCVQELPEFNALQKRYANAPVKVVLVSLDFKENYPKLPTFLQRKKITPEVVWLTDTNPNEFIPKIDNRWEGSIPATIIVAPGKQQKQFIEGQVTEKQVAQIVQRMMAASSASGGRGEE